MKSFKKRSLIFSVVAALTLVSAVPALAAESPRQSAIIVEDPTLPEITPFAENIRINNQSLRNTGHSWDQTPGFQYGRVYISNTQSQTLNVYISYKSGGQKVNIWTGTISPNNSKVILITNANGNTYHVDYNTANGNVSGIIHVRESDVPFG